LLYRGLLLSLGLRRFSCAPIVPHALVLQLAVFYMVSFLDLYWCASIFNQSKRSCNDTTLAVTYADGTKLFSSVNPSEVNHTLDWLKKCLVNIISWLLNFYVTVHFSVPLPILARLLVLLHFYLKATHYYDPSPASFFLYAVTLMRDVGTACVPKALRLYIHGLIFGFIYTDDFSTRHVPHPKC